MVMAGKLQRGSRWLLAVAGIILVSAAIIVARGFSGGESALFGTELDGRPSPDFALIDQRGETIGLSDFRRRAVALTFIYTNCPDICPITAENLRVAYELLPTAARDDVALVAVTLDPARDSQQALQAFTAAHRLTDNPNWFALRGDPETLEGVWQDYGIDPGGPEATPDGLGHSMPGGGVGHTDGIYFIDPEGRQRAFMRSTATPRQIADNLAAMLD